MPNATAIILAASGLVLSACARENTSAASAMNPIAEAFVDGINSYALDELVGMVTSDIVWTEVAGNQTQTLARGREEFEQALFATFEFPVRRIALSDEWVRSGDYVSTTQIHVITWPDQRVTEHEVLAVYEITANSKIARIWEFTSQQQAQDDPPFLEF